MSRAKNKWARKLTNKPVEDQLGLAKYGRCFDGNENAFAFVQDWYWLFDAFDHQDDPKEFANGRWKSRAEFKAEFKLYTNDLLHELCSAIRTGNATFFKSLAVALSHQAKDPDDALRHWLLVLFKRWNHLKDQPQRFTLAQIKRALTVFGMRVDDRHLRRVCEEIGIDLARDRVGRPSKEKNSDNSASK